MNLAKLFMLQSELDAHIEDQHPRQDGESRANKKILALLVELGELANEWRGFKFWSNNQQPNNAISVLDEIGGKQFWKPINPLLEEFVDGIHFLLSIGLEMHITNIAITKSESNDIVTLFINCFNCFSLLRTHFSEQMYNAAFSAYIQLGELLGFSWDEVEAAYLSKNVKNHARQEGGY